MQSLYFAYGSNLLSRRMRERVPSAVLRGSARLADRRLTTDKRGRDGTGKANLREDPGGSVWGVIWEIDPGHWRWLDACERGYARVPVEVRGAAGALLRAETYVSILRAPEPVLASAYKRLIVAGAREQALPARWVALLEALPESP